MYGFTLHVGETTPDVGESTLDVGEQTVGETTRRRNDRLPSDYMQYMTKVNL